MPIKDLKTQLRNLVQLQTVDSEIYALKGKKVSKPAEIEALEGSFEEKKSRLSELEKSALELQTQKKDRELELASKEESIKKLQAQLYTLKTNKEYQSMLQQIDGAKADVSVIEDKILESMDLIDKSKSDIEKEKQHLKEEESLLNEKKKKVQDEIKEIDDFLAQKETKRKQLIPDIDEKIFAEYERILASREGLAIVFVKDNSCSGCNMFVPPQVINLIKMYENIVTCEVCNRILYVDDETV